MTSNVLGIITIVVDAAVAVFTAWMAYSTRQMAHQTQNSVEAERGALERAKDSLMPVLEISCQLRNPTNPTKSNDIFALTVTNVGVGPAFIREITTREEVSRHDVYRSSLRATVVPAGATTSGTFGGSLTIKVKEHIMSSLSVWYTDVYGRWYRTRVVIQYPSLNDKDQWIRVRTLISEFLPHISESSFSDGDFDNMYPDNYVGRYELGRLVHTGELLSPQWHTLESIQRVRGSTISGADISHGTPIRVIGMSWWFGEPFPEFSLQIKNYDPFVLGIRQNHDDGNRKPIIMGAETLRGFCASMPPPLIPNAHQAPLEQWGLNNTNRAETDLLVLYRTITDTIKGILNPVTAPNESSKSS